MHLNMTVQMFPTTVRLGTPLVGAVKQSAAAATASIGVVCVRHVLLVLLLLLNVVCGLSRGVLLDDRRSRAGWVGSARLQQIKY